MRYARRGRPGVPRAADASPGTGIRIGTHPGPEGLVEVALDLFGDVAEQEGGTDCLEDRAWTLEWPVVAEELVMNTDVVFAGDALPEGEPPIAELPPKPITIESLPPETQAELLEAIRRP